MDGSSSIHIDISVQPFNQSWSWSLKPVKLTLTQMPKHLKHPNQFYYKMHRNSNTFIRFIKNLNCNLTLLFLLSSYTTKLTSGLLSLVVFHRCDIFIYIFSFKWIYSQIINAQDIIKNRRFMRINIIKISAFLGHSQFFNFYNSNRLHLTLNDSKLKVEIMQEAA